MRLLLPIVLLIGLTLPLQGQTNLVPNGDFEDVVNCPDYNFGNLMTYCIGDWVTPTLGSPDYFSVCGDSDFGFTPSTAFYGSQLPHSGGAYIGMYYFALGQPEGREYAQVELTAPLQAGVRYKVSFYASLADMSLYAISSLGAYLSENAPSINQYWLLNVEPQVLNPSGNILTDTSGWVLVTDTFASRAGGGEKFLTIGNFNYAAVSDTFLHNPTGDHNYTFAYYYIDDVSVVTLDSVTSGMEEQEDLCFEVWPNPAREVLKFKVQGSRWQAGGLSVRVVDAVGREVQTPPGTPPGEVNGNIDVSGLPKGIYLLELTDAEGKRAVRRFVKE